MSEASIFDWSVNIQTFLENSSLLYYCEEVFLIISE